MRILFPIGSFYPAQSGGPNNSIYWLTKALAVKGVKCTIITTDKGLKLNNEIVLDKWLDKEYGKIIYAPAIIYQLPLRMIYHTIKQIKNSDLIHLTSVSYLPSIIIGTIGFILNKRIIWSPRGELEIYARDRHLILKRVRFYLIKCIFRKKVIFHSTCLNESENIKRYLGGKRIFLLPNYMLIPKQLNINIKNQLLSIGRLDPIKALENVIEGLFISKEFVKSNFRFVIAGSGDNGYIKLLNNKIKEFSLQEKIVFIGHVSGPEKDFLYASSYFTLLLSHSENFGNVVVESLCQGTPVITSKGTPWEDIDRYKAGFWIENAPSAIAKVIDKIIILDSAEYNAYRLNSRYFVESNFDIEKKVDNWIIEYQNAINSK